MYRTRWDVPLSTVGATAMVATRSVHRPESRDSSCDCKLEGVPVGSLGTFKTACALPPIAAVPSALTRARTSSSASTAKPRARSTARPSAARAKLEAYDSLGASSDPLLKNRGQIARGGDFHGQDARDTS